MDLPSGGKPAVAGKGECRGTLLRRRARCRHSPSMSCLINRSLLFVMSPEATIDLIIRDAWFASHTVVDVVPGDDRLVLERCTFMGGTVHVDPEVDRQIFVACLVQGTTFTCNLCHPASRPIALGNRQTSRALCQSLGSPDSSRAAQSHAVRRVSAYSIVVYRHPVAPGRVGGLSSLPGSTRWTAGAVPFDSKNALRHGRIQWRGDLRGLKLCESNVSRDTSSRFPSPTRRSDGGTPARMPLRRS
jgi:hypothetical protein